MDSPTFEKLLAHLRLSQVAVIYVMVENNTEKLDLPDEDMPASVTEKEEVLRRIEAHAHSEGGYNFMSTLVPSARSRMTRAGIV